MTNSLISILMPVKDTSIYLRECLESILNQTEANWELIAVDDHSSDESYQILSEYKSLDPRIKVFKNNNIGIISALRLALQEARGSLITRMDSDDIMPEEKIFLLKEKLQSKGQGNVVTGLVKYFSNEKLGEGYLKYERWLNKLSQNGKNYSEIYKECVIPSPCWMVYKEDLYHCGAFFSDIYPEDYDLCFRFYKHQLKIQVVNEVLHYWRDSPLRVSRTSQHYADQKFFEVKLKYFIQMEACHDQPILLWGAGKKGKQMASLLQTENISFSWVCNNDRKHNHQIYGVTISAPVDINWSNGYKIIIVVSSRGAEEIISRFLEKENLNSGKDFFFFC